MITQTVLTSVGMFVAISLKTLQGRSIANRNMKVIPVVSFLICLIELSVYGVVITQGITGSTLFVAIGAAIGSVVGVMAADVINDRLKGDSNGN